MRPRSPFPPLLSDHPAMKPFVLLMLVILFVACPLRAQDLLSDPAVRQVQPGIPVGKVTQGVFATSREYPGTTREFRVYVPAQYQESQPANLMVFMDGKNYAKPDGEFRVPIVFDNLIDKQQMPVTIAVFVDPGTIEATKLNAVARSNRSLEYDSLGDRYSRFLIDEFLPVALQGLNVTSDPSRRAVCGISSGGICAFTVAWERPDQFGKVLSHIGSFTNIRGGWAYPGLVRKSKSNPKPIKVYLQDGEDDLDNLHGDWPLANRDLAAALQFAGYTYKFVVTEGGHSGKAGGSVLPDALRWLWSDDAESMHIASTESKPTWQPHPDAVPRDDVPKGKTEVMPAWGSKVFANTTRPWAVYVPAQYDPTKPTALMVFQDGERLRDVGGRWRVPVVFDNLIARGEMPPTIAVFINPGDDKAKGPNKKPSNRSLEYDSLGDRYSQLLRDEILPVVAAKYNISTDPEMRAIGGSSSGAICAFTVAWEHPDLFGKVYSNVGSFTNIRGGDVYSSLIRKTETKPIRVYMADTSGDIDNAFGSWPLANQKMAASLRYMGYAVRFDWAEGYAHNADFGSSRFPDAMRWLWRNEIHEPVIDTHDDLKSDFTLLRLLVPGESWEVAADGLGFADAACADQSGKLYFSDMKAPAIYRIGVTDAAPQLIAKEAVSGLKFGPDGKLYGCQGAKNQVISIDIKTGAVAVIASGVTPNDLVVTPDGFIFITETKAKQVTRINLATNEVTTADTGITRPNGIAITGDGGTLAVSDSGGSHVWAFRINPDASLDAKMAMMSLRLPIDKKGEFKFNEPPPYLPASGGDGMTIDRSGRYYVTTTLGVQIFDPTGRLCGVLPKPDEAKPLTSCTLGGPDHDVLYVTNGTTIFRRKLTVAR